MSENPQKENGHIDIANEIAEALCRLNLSPYESRVLWCIFRKTYGWQKKDDWISLSQFVEITGIRKQHVCRALRLLQDRNIVTKGGNKFAFNKFYSQWRALPKGVTTHHVTEGGKKSLPKGGHTIDNVTKDNTLLTKSTAGAAAPSTEKKDARDPNVQVIIDVFKNEMKLPLLDGTVKGNRHAAYRLWKKFNGLVGMTPDKAMRNIVGAIKYACENDYWKKRLTSISDLERNIMKILQEARDQ